MCVLLYVLTQPDCSTPSALALKAESGKQRGLLLPGQIVGTHRSASCLVMLGNAQVHPASTSAVPPTPPLTQNDQ